MHLIQTLACGLAISSALVSYTVVVMLNALKAWGGGRKGDSNKINDGDFEQEMREKIGSFSEQHVSELGASREQVRVGITYV